jgi:hypothetical protein
MDKLPALILVSFFTCFTITANAQYPGTTQLSATPIERTLGAGQTHEFTIKVEENSFVQVAVDQRGIDVIVKVFAPDSKSLGEFDSPTGASGVENVAFVAAAAGNYRIVVGPLDPTVTGEGRYQITLVELRAATDQELKSSKNREAVKAKGLALLTEIEGLIPQIKSPQTRIRTQIQVAQLFWETDEKRGAKYIADAITTFKDYLASLDSTTQEYFQQYQTCVQLRQEMVQVLGARDPEVALNFLYSTPLPSDPSGAKIEQLSQENMLELMVAAQFLQKDPNRALKIARQNLRKGFSSNLITVVSELQNKKPELAVELANEIAAKLLNEKLLKDREASMVALNLVRLAQASQKAAGENPKNSPPQLVTEDKYNELLEKIVKEALAYSPPATPQNWGMERDSAWLLLTGLQSFGPDLDTVVEGSAAAIEKKVSEFDIRGIAQVVGPPDPQGAVANSPVDAALEVIEKAPEETQERLYMQLAAREAMNGDGTRARQIINEHVTNLFQRRQALASIEQQEINRAVSSGKAEEALRGISLIRNPRERAAQLLQIAGQIGPGLKRANAINLLEQARSMLGPSLQAQNDDQMRALFEIARVYSRYDSKRAFEIMDPLIDQVNDLCVALRRLDGFGVEGFEDDELNLRSGQSVAVVAGQMAAALGSLALVNFEGAKTAAERIRLPEVRLQTYLEIAQQAVWSPK